MGDVIIRDPDEFPEDVRNLADAVRWVVAERKLSLWKGSENYPAVPLVNGTEVSAVSLPPGCETVQVNGRVTTTQLTFIERWVGVCTAAHAALGQHIPE